MIRTLNLRWSVVVFMVVTVCLLLFFASIPKHASAEERNPVVFVHGYTGNDWNFISLMNYLKRQGWPDSHVSAIQYSNNLGSNVNNAHELSAFVDNVLARTGADKVDLVAHSMGGLSTRYYIKNLDGGSKVANLVTIGSPHQGTYNAVWGSATAGAREMIPGSLFLLRLNAGDETPDGTDPNNPILYTTIYSTGDTLVPTYRTTLDGARRVRVIGVSHIGLLTSSTVERHVLDALNGGGLNDN
ncbi:esterase/lipase family protein [Pueribacillus sp. YX66]|uniref:esterase/lipase family protein n=1 Tax=Pueribacillus sp. YX66 TaxID=3229242 RepID=UPI00358D8330